MGVLQEDEDLEENMDVADRGDGDQDVNADLTATLKIYEKLSEHEENHQILIKDKTVLLYTATLLNEENDWQIMDLCLGILTNLAHNQRTHQPMLATFGLFESLESLAISSRRRLRQPAIRQHKSPSSSSQEISQKASQLVAILRASAPTTYGQQNAVPSVYDRIKTATQCYQLHVPNLTTRNRPLLDEALLSIKGLVSFVIDVEETRCTVRICSRVGSLQKVVGEISKRADLDAYVIARNRLTGAQELINLFENQENDVSEYTKLSDKSYINWETNTKNFELCERKRLTLNPGTILQGVKDFWNCHFHW